jgi:hypothetical protein
MSILSMIIGYLDTFGTRIRPNETNPELIIEADRMLASTTALQRLQPIRRRGPKV